MPKKSLLKSSLNWLHYNRLLIVIILFFVILPITLITTVYLGAHIRNRRVHFDPIITDQTEFITSFKTPDQLRHLEIFIEWENFRSPIENAEGDLVGGFYRFNIRFEAKEDFNISQVHIIPVLQTRWVNYRSIGNMHLLSESFASFDVLFNFNMPARPLWFVRVDDPILYIKVMYARTLANQTVIQETEYIMFTLNGLNPKNVTPHL